MRWIPVFLLVLFGCSKSPFPDGNLSPLREPDSSKFSLQFREIMDFKEETLSEYKVIGNVPAPGAAVISVKGLPQGSLYLANGSFISWNPPSGSGTDPENPTSGHRVYPIKIVLCSNLDPKNTLERSAVLNVSSR